MDRRVDAKRAKPGPDPVIGVGLFAVGLLIMATGGAFTWHYVFNVGEGILLLGAVIFLVNVTLTSHRQRPVDWRALARELLGKEDSKKLEP